MSNHSVSDLVSRIKNGCLAKKQTISSPVSKLRENILAILKEEGYISSYSKSKSEGSAHEKFDIHLKYHNSKPVITEIEVVSKPGRRVYRHVDGIPLTKNGLGSYVISTSKGIVTDYEARKQRVGGEILFKIF